MVSYKYVLRRVMPLTSNVVGIYGLPRFGCLGILLCHPALMLKATAAAIITVLSNRSDILACR